MKTKLLFIIAIFATLTFTSCEDVVQLEGPKSDSFLIVDGTITNQKGEQVIALSQSQDYFNNATVKGITNATVKVTDNEGKVYEFKDLKNVGKYVWTPKSTTEIMGAIGKTYTLEITSNGETFRAVSEMKRVPKIDSIAYQADTRENETDPKKPKEGFEAQFYGRDIAGIGDCYRVKSFKNKKELELRRGGVQLAYDAAVQKSRTADGLVFILPLRRSISPDLFVEKDTITVQLTSITEGHFDFWTQAIQEVNNAGLFSRPSANIPTNVININTSSSKKGAGWFGTSAMSTFTTIVDAKKARTGLK
jgi:uncharacterized protein (DUF2141 family)